MFLAESREHLQELNLAVLKIEENPEDKEKIDEIFRCAHSMKGMSATMGFAAMAELTHKMEDVFELLRQRSGGLSRDAIDAVLACLDMLESGVQNIDEHGEERLDPKALIERLDGLVHERTPEQKAVKLGGVAPDQAELVRLAAGRPVIHVVAKLTDDVSMPSVRAFMAIGACSNLGDVLVALPDEEAMEQFSGGIVEAWVVDADADALRNAVAEVEEVERVEVEEIDVEQLMIDGPVDEVEEAAVDAPEAAPDAPAEQKAAKKSGGGAAKTVRVDAERLDQLMHYMAEVVVHRTQLEALVADADHPGLATAMQEMTRSSQSLQTMVMQVRMIPVEAVFVRFPRLVRDLSGKLGKDVQLVLEGQETELDRTVVDALGDPLVHLIRNSVDHGFEPPEERLRLGKPEQGTLQVLARPTGGGIVITVKDDGRGVDPKKVAAVAVKRGLISPEDAELVDVPRAVELLFSAGFSTAEKATDVSGRGVGMDAVRNRIRELGGDVIMDSVTGQGTETEIRLPLSLAITSALLVEAGESTYAVAIDRIERTVRIQDWVVRGVAGRPMLVMGDEVSPLIDAGAVLGTDPNRPEGCAASDKPYAVLVSSQQGRTIALAVDGLLGQRELVCRSLPPEVGEDVPVAAAAVLSSGEIALVVDVDGLTREHDRSVRDELASTIEENHGELHRSAA
ncbi:MAG: chemotaxis protein CheA [Solirubrobacteraceae bacterium]|nr:chemotaxis protein CheA [Solirubrobacteraceae bacterium]